MKSNHLQMTRSMLTMCIIFGTAFLLATMGCGSSSTPNTPAVVAPPVGPEGLDEGGAQTPVYRDVIPAPADPSRLKICTADQLKRINSAAPTIKSAVTAIEKQGAKPELWTKDASVVNLSKNAERVCDPMVTDFTTAPCKKPTHAVVNPDSPALVYDGASVYKMCSKPYSYLSKFGLRQNQGASVPAAGGNGKPPVNNPPVVIDQGPIQPNQPVGNLKACSADEFLILKNWSAELDAANKNIAKLGAQSSWKYDSAAIASAKLATRSCEAAIKRHTASPCSKDGKVYNGETLRERCVTARTYFYEFAQNQTSLNFPNADLYLDVRGFETQKFEAGYIDMVQGCRVDNPTKTDLDYSARPALIKDSRGFEDKIMVLETQEGLLLQCYGLNLDGPFSKNQIVRILKEEGSNIPLHYILK